MKYIIIGYTSDVDIKTNTAKIRYASFHYEWTTDLKNALTFNTRDEAEEFIETNKFRYARSYGIEILE